MGVFGAILGIFGVLKIVYKGARIDQRTHELTVVVVTHRQGMEVTVCQIRVHGYHRSPFACIGEDL